MPHEKVRIQMEKGLAPTDASDGKQVCEENGYLAANSLFVNIDSLKFIMFFVLELGCWKIWTYPSSDEY